MTNTAICYVTDKTYLGPTIISISSIRDFISLEVKVYLVITFDDTALLDPISEVLTTLGVEVIRLPEDIIEAVTGVWREGYVSKTALGRFFLPQLLPSEVDKILYLDGDTLIVDDLSELLAFPMPAGKAGFVEDAYSFYRNDQSLNGEASRRYFAGLGLAADAPYVNSGVFLAGSKDWGVIAEEALAFIREKPELCMFHDQSAINAVLGERRLKLSPKWNYQTRFKALRAKFIGPATVYHLNGQNKPWMGEVFPWQFLTALLRQRAKTLGVDGLLGVLSPKEVMVHNSEYGGLKELVRKVIDVRRKKRVGLVKDLYHTAVI